MSVYVYADAIQKLSVLLEEAFQGKDVRIQRDDGQEFVIKPSSTLPSPLDVEGINLGITTDEIIDCIHEGRKDTNN